MNDKDNKMTVSLIFIGLMVVIFLLIIRIAEYSKNKCIVSKVKGKGFKIDYDSTLIILENFTYGDRIYKSTSTQEIDDRRIEYFELEEYVLADKHMPQFKVTYVLLSNMLGNTITLPNRRKVCP
jgi:hypothetical protein